jgi:pyridoxal phosphate enzyme (YggS family)
MDQSTVKFMNIRNNYLSVVDRIIKAAKSAGRDPDSIHLVVVTKTQTADTIQAVIDAGANNLGENYIEEAIPKINMLKHNPGINWHMIGHVQSRKAAYVCEYFQFLHSLDSVKLAEKISRHAVEAKKTIPVWLELNVGGEITKSGWNIWEDDKWVNIVPDFEKVIGLPGIKLLGLMTIPPYSIDPEISRPYYKKLRKFQEFLIKQFDLNDFNELSMGMSADFEIAIQEGSTCLRVGQAILGPRIYY